VGRGTRGEKKGTLTGNEKKKKLNSRMILNLGKSEGKKGGEKMDQGNFWGGKGADERGGEDASREGKVSAEKERAAWGGRKKGSNCARKRTSAKTGVGKKNRRELDVGEKRGGYLAGGMSSQPGGGKGWSKKLVCVGGGKGGAPLHTLGGENG